MKRTHSAWPRTLSLVALLAAGLIWFGPDLRLQARGNPNPRILPPHSSPHGLTYGEWSTEWWKWAVGIPAAENPVLDETGEFADVDQSGSVWFLAGTLGGSDVIERTVSIPPGKALLFPLVAYVYWAPDDLALAASVAESLGLNSEEMTDEELLRVIANFSLLELSELTLTIDGVEMQDLERYRAQSPGFSVDDDDLLDDFGLPADGHDLFVSAGYWVMLAPLPVGEHTIHFTAVVDDSPLGPSAIDVTYNITVAPR